MLQTLAVIGKEFPLGLVERSSRKSDDELSRMLADLQLAEFIYEQPAVGDIEYTFKHALTQEVAYNSVLIERRKLLHERAGQAIESLFAEQLDDHSPNWLITTAAAETDRRQWSTCDLRGNKPHSGLQMLRRSTISQAPWKY